MTPTQKNVIDAIHVVAAHLSDAGYVEALIVPSGGVSFNKRSTHDKLQELFGTITRLITDRNRLERERGKLRKFIRNIECTDQDWWDGEVKKLLAPRRRKTR